MVSFTASEHRTGRPEVLEFYLEDGKLAVLTIGVCYWASSSGGISGTVIQLKPFKVS
jgi:hypothetical protein